MWNIQDVKKFIKTGIRGVAAAIVIGLGVWAWWHFQPQDLPDGFAAGNGRIEAVEIDIAARTAGRVREIVVNEGEFVRAGQVLAKMDTAVLEAQLQEAEAQLRRALIGIETAQSQVTQRKAEKQAAEALIAQREAELDAAQRRVARSEEAVRATIQRIQADIDDSVLKSPRDGRVQYRVAQPGEVLSPGGVVLNMVDLTDVYMTFFLPTEQAGRVALGAETRLVLDAAPQYVVPAKISFVADVAQFTPKTVETEEERQKLMFRIKARIDPDLLRKHLHQVKTGLPGMAYVRLDPRVDWPPELQARLPQ